MRRILSHGEEDLRNSKKNVARFSGSTYPRYPKGTTAEGASPISTHDYMSTSKVHRGTFLVLAATLACFYPHFAWADGEEMAVSSTESTTTEDFGTGIFSRFPLQVSASVRGGYDDNITASNFNKQGSWFTNAGVALKYNFGSPRTRLSLETVAGLTYYWDQPSDEGTGNDEYRPNLNLRLSLSHKASPRMTLEASVYATYQSEPDFTLAQGLSRRTGNFFFTQDQFSVAYLWTPRFSTATSYTFGAVKYDDSAIGFFQDRIENTFGNQFRFLIWPTTTVVGEYRFQVVTYDDIARDSTTHFILAGFDHKFNTRLHASVRGGAEFRDYENSGSQESPYFEGALTYALGKDTSITWSNRYGIEESDALLNPGRKTFRTGLQASHALTSRISGTLGAFYQHDDYFGAVTPTSASGSFIEEAFDIALSLRYAITRNFGLEAGYSHTEVTSDVSLREYSRNRVWAGLNLSF